MANHPNRNWRGKWTLEGDTATHISGLVVKVLPGNDARSSDAKAVVVPSELSGNTKTIMQKLLRLMFEACDLYFEARHD